MTNLFTIKHNGTSIALCDAVGNTLRNYNATPDDETLANTLCAQLEASVQTAIHRTMLDFDTASLNATMYQILYGFSLGNYEAEPLTEKGFSAGIIEANFSVVQSHTKEVLPRWLLISASNRRDRDKQLVTEKALKGAVVIGDATGFHGPLRWWHTKEKGKVLDLGTCDFQMVYKGFLIESGTFVSAAVAQAVSRVSHLLKASIGFIHPKSEPDSAGMFHNIAIYERSLLPKGTESNQFTSLMIA